MFQPAEEGPGGAKPMIEAGLLEGPKVDYAFALHMWNDLPTGQIGVRSGPVMASADEFTIKVVGVGGHGAAPHQTIDPVVVSCQIVNALQTIVSRNVDPTKCAVVTVGKIASGNRFNIIPAEATIVGTVRALEEPVRLLAKRRIKEIAENVAKAFGAKAELDYDDGYPPTVNDATAAGMMRKAAGAVVGAKNVVEQDITLGAEDMSYVLQKVPGCYWFLGSANKKKGLVHPHHSAKFDFDEDSLPIGVEIWRTLAEQVLGK
jgi:amidohydrolase